MENNELKRGARLMRLERREAGGMSCEYRLYSKRSASVASFGLTLYSFSVTLMRQGEEQCRADIEDAFADEGRARLFFDELVRARVHPRALGYFYERALGEALKN